LHPVWTRDLPGEISGVLAFAEKDRTRVVAVGGGAIITFAGDGETKGKFQAPSWAGRLVDFGRDATGAKEVAAFRPGATMMGIISLPSGTSRNIDCGSPIATAASINPSSTENRALAIVTTTGTSLARSGDAEAKPFGGVPTILDLARDGGEGVVALYEDGFIGPIATTPHREPFVARGAARLLSYSEDRAAAVGPRAVVASALGRFLPGDRKQLAVATYSGHVTLLDAFDGTVLVDLVWPDARDLSAADLDGDGRDDLVVGAGRFVTVLSGVPR
jgi:hypothetical protein